METNNTLNQINSPKPLLILICVWVLSIILILCFSDKEDRILTAEQLEDEYLYYGDPYIYFQVLEHREQLESQNKKAELP